MTNNRITLNRDSLAAIIALDYIAAPDAHDEFLNADTPDADLAELIADDLHDLMHNSNQFDYLAYYDIDMTALNDDATDPISTLLDSIIESDDFPDMIADILIRHRTAMNSRFSPF